MKTIEYQSTNYNVTDKVFNNWLKEIEQLNKIIGLPSDELEAASQWATYNVLIDDGLFVKKPTEPIPGISNILNDKSPIDQFPLYEEDWTKEKILQERKKLLDEREKWLTKKEKLFSESTNYYRPAEVYITPNVEPQQSITGAVIVIVILILLAAICGAQF